jgi:DNA-3-methyladenine glycosylase
MEKLPNMSASKDKFPDLSSSLKAAKSLLGWKLVHDSPAGLTSGFIVETEAYDMTDPASHAFGGERLRNRSMFMPAGTVYVYFTYGMHHCVNIVTGQKGYGQGVLLRALEPVDGIDLMKKRRNTEIMTNLCSGPAKLVQAMGITMTDDGSMLGEGLLRLEPGIKPKQVVQTTRVGISKAIDQPWRFYVADNPYVSKR